MALLQPRSTAGPGTVVRRNALVAFVLLGGLLVLGKLLEVGAQGTHLGNLTGPQCLVRSWFGEGACPGCGLTRASALVLDGSYQKAFSVNAGGFALVGVFALWMVVYALVAIRGQRTLVSEWWLEAGRWVLLIGVACGWILRNVSLFR